MRLLAFGSLVFFNRRELGRLEAMRELLKVDEMTEHEAEDAQAARECASADRNDDPHPGAFYGLPADEPEPTPCPASTTNSPATT